MVQCWALGDLAISLPFIRAAQEKYEILLVAKPYAAELVNHLAPLVKHIPLEAPWTRFRGKYMLHRWPWSDLRNTLAAIRKWRPDVAVSSRWDPRDHLLMVLSGARKRVGFPRLASRLFLTHPLSYGKELKHKHEDWRLLANELDLNLPAIPNLATIRPENHLPIILHTGAAQKVRVWPLERYRGLVQRIRSWRIEVRVLCDHDQLEFWKGTEPSVMAPTTVSELIDALKTGSCFIGNDSGPGHLAAVMGLPTLTLFGPQLPIWFTPPHPAAEWIEGRVCPYKPCFDYCRFETPHCLFEITEQEVADKVRRCLQKWGITSMDL